MRNKIIFWLYYYLMFKKYYLDLFWYSNCFNLWLDFSVKMSAPADHSLEVSEQPNFEMMVFVISLSFHGFMICAVWYFLHLEYFVGNNAYSAASTTTTATRVSASGKSSSTQNPKRCSEFKTRGISRIAPSFYLWSLVCTQGGDLAAWLAAKQGADAAPASSPRLPLRVSSSPPLMILPHLSFQTYSSAFDTNVKQDPRERLEV